MSGFLIALALLTLLIAWDTHRIVNEELRHLDEWAEKRGSS